MKVTVKTFGELVKKRRKELGLNQGELALVEWFQSGREDRLETYSATCLRRVWRAEHFSWWMTSMLHRFDDDGPFEHRLHLAQLEYVCGSIAASTMLAENYVGMPMV